MDRRTADVTGAEVISDAELYRQSLTVAVCLFAATVTIGTATSRVAAGLERHVGTVKRWTGWVLVVVGVWFVVLSVFATAFESVFSV